VEHQGKCVARVIKAIQSARLALFDPDLAERSAFAYDPKSPRPSVDDNHWVHDQGFTLNGAPKTKSDIILAACPRETTIDDVCERLGWTPIEHGPLIVPSTKLLASFRLIEQCLGRCPIRGMSGLSATKIVVFSEWRVSLEMLKRLLCQSKLHIHSVLIDGRTTS